MDRNLNRRSRLSLAAVAAIATLALAAAPANAGYGAPRQAKQVLHGVQISTTVGGRIVVRLHVSKRYIRHRFRITANGKLVAHGRVSKKGNILTLFGTKHNKAAQRGAVIVVKIDGKIFKWIRR